MARRKKNPKKQGQAMLLLGQHQMYQHSNHKGAGNLFEKVMKENFPNLVKEIGIQVQEAQRVLIKLDPKRPTPRHIIIKTSKVKDKERILKAAREKKKVSYKGVPIRLSNDFSKETLQARSIESDEKQGPTTKIILSSKAIIQNGRADSVFQTQ